MTMLNGRLLLHGVDAEKLARKALDDTLKARNINLDSHRYEDALSELVTAAWELSERFKSGNGHSFSTGCYRLLRLRFIDWVRKTEGRTTWQSTSGVYTRAIPDVLSLDWEIHAQASEEHGTYWAKHQKLGLGEVIATGPRDSSDDRSPDLVWALVSGGRNGQGDHVQSSVESTGRPGRGDTPEPRVRKAA